MAHQCFECGSECYCNGDIDDVITSKTPLSCKGCGCDAGLDYDDEDDEEPIGYACNGCGKISGLPGFCRICNNPLEPYY